MTIKPWFVVMVHLERSPSGTGLGLQEMVPLFGGVMLVFIGRRLVFDDVKEAEQLLLELMVI